MIFSYFTGNVILRLVLCSLPLVMCEVTKGLVWYCETMISCLWTLNTDGPCVPYTLLYGQTTDSKHRRVLNTLNVAARKNILLFMDQECCSDKQIMAQHCYGLRS